MKKKERQAIIGIQVLIQNEISNRDESKIELEDTIKSGVAYAIQWKMESAVISEEIVNMMSYLNATANTRVDEVNLDILPELTKRTKKRAMDFFKMKSFRPNSTNPASNLVNIYKGHAASRVLDICESIQRELDSINDPED